MSDVWIIISAIIGFLVPILLFAIGLFFKKKNLKLTKRLIIIAIILLIVELFSGQSKPIEDYQTTNVSFYNTMPSILMTFLFFLIIFSMVATLVVISTTPSKKDV